MLEQSTLNGKVFYSQQSVEDGKARLATRAVDIMEVKFGQPTNIKIHRNPKTTMFMVENVDIKKGIVYDGNGQKVTLTDAKTNDDDLTDEYRYGFANYHGDIQPYFIQNDPEVMFDGEPDWEHFELPPTLEGYPYERTFSYLPELVDLLGNCPATNVDRYKRPLNAKALLYHRYLPTSINKVETTFKEMAEFKRHFPIVAMLNQEDQPTQFAVLDLEPKAEDADRKIVEQYEAYYVEDTPHGGKHYLVKADPDDHAFKYRLTDNLEVQIDTMITFYGLNGKMLNPNPSVSHFDKECEVGHKVHQIDSVERPNEVGDEVEKLIKINTEMGSRSKRRVYRDYMADEDLSHADFVALVHLFNSDVKPYLKDLNTDMLAWTTAEYAETIIPPRAKHNEVRLGVPYLVFLADEVIQSQLDNSEKGKIF